MPDNVTTSPDDLVQRLQAHRAALLEHAAQHGQSSRITAALERIDHALAALNRPAPAQPPSLTRYAELERKIRDGTAEENEVLEFLQLTQSQAKSQTP